MIRLTQQKTPDQHHTTSVRLACGTGERFLRDVWAYVVFDAGHLARLGVKATPDTAPQDFSPEEDEQFGMMPGLEADTLPGRIVRFLGHLIEEHYWRYEYNTNSWPLGFAGLLHGDKNIQAEQWEKHRDVWEYTCAIESAAKEWPELAKLREKAFFMDRVHTQLIFRLLDHIGFQQDHEYAPQILALIRRGHHRIGDSVVVEKAAKIARKAEQHDQEHRQVGAHNLLHQLRQAKRNPLAERDIQEVVVPESSWDAEVKPKQGWSKLMHTSTHLLSKWGAQDCLLQGTAIPSRRHALMALQIAQQLCTERRGKDAGDTWQACAVAGQALVKDIRTCSYFWVIGAAADGFVKWEATVVCPGPCFTWGLPLGNRWEKVTLTGVMHYEYVPHVWKGGDYNPHNCGFLYMVPTTAPVPLVVEALCRAAPRLLLNQRVALVQLYKRELELPQGASQQESEFQLITKLVGEEAAKRYLERCAAVWQAMVKKHQQNSKAGNTDADAGAEDSEEGWSSGDEEIPAEIEDHLLTAIDAMDPNQLPERLRRKYTGAARRETEHKAMKQLRAGLAKTSSSSKESNGTAPDCGGSSTPGQAVPSEPEVATPDCGGSSAHGHTACSKPEVEVPLPACEIPEAPADPNWKRRCNEEWVRPFLPHGLADFDCHLETGVEGEIEWVARYSPKDPDKHPLSGEVPKQYRTKSVTCTQMKCPTDHSVFLGALDFVWGRHKLWHPECTVPTIVEEALAATCCHRPGSFAACEASMDALRATGLANSSQRQNEPPKVCCDICGVNLHTTAACPLMQQILQSDAKLTAKTVLTSAHQLQCQVTLGQQSCGLAAFRKVHIKVDGTDFYAVFAWQQQATQQTQFKG